MWPPSPATGGWNSMIDVGTLFEKKSLISHMIAGYPDIETTGRLIRGMAEAGVDMVIVEIPFSDPIAGGPEIKGVHATALSAGVTTDLIFDTLKEIRSDCKVPIAIMTYYNPIFVYGKEKFVARCDESDVRFIMVPDLPFEEREELRPFCSEKDVLLVPMVAPTYPERMNRILDDAEGFVYIVRFEDAAGFPEGFVHELADMADLVHAHGLRCISDSGQGEAGDVLKHVDGAVDGTDVMTLVMRHGRDCVQFVADYARGVRTRI